MGILGTMAGSQEAIGRQANLFSWFACKLEVWVDMSLCWEWAVPILLQVPPSRFTSFNTKKQSNRRASKWEKDQVGQVENPATAGPRRQMSATHTQEQMYILICPHQASPLSFSHFSVYTFLLFYTIVMQTGWVSPAPPCGRAQQPVPQSQGTLAAATASETGRWLGPAV